MFYLTILNWLYFVWECIYELLLSFTVSVDMQMPNWILIFIKMEIEKFDYYYTFYEGTCLQGFRTNRS